MFKIQLIFLLNLYLTNSQRCEGGKLVGGEASPKHYEYQVSIQMKTRNNEGGNGFFFFQQPKSNYSHFCAGSVLNKNYIVTAAHCVKGFNISSMSVFAGEKDLREESKGSRHSFENCVIHPEYVELNHSDIAVCRLSSPLPLGSKIQPIALSKSYVGEDECILTGWGYTSIIRGFSLPHVLQREKFRTISNDECRKRGHNVGPREICTLSR